MKKIALLFALFILPVQLRAALLEPMLGYHTAELETQNEDGKATHDIHGWMYGARIGAQFDFGFLIAAEFMLSSMTAKAKDGPSNETPKTKFYATQIGAVVGWKFNDSFRAWANFLLLSDLKHTSGATVYGNPDDKHKGQGVKLGGGWMPFPAVPFSINLEYQIVQIVEKYDAAGDATNKYNDDKGKWNGWLLTISAPLEL